MIHDRIWPPYFTVHQAKNANGGLWPKDLSSANRLNPGIYNYVYNLMTGYGYEPPVGADVPEGKYFNPYYDHMILGMAPQLHDGMIEYDDGTPSSAPQMAHDVSEFLYFMSARSIPDLKLVQAMIFGFIFIYYPMTYLFTKYHFVNTMSHRVEMYAIKNGGYKKFREKMFRTHKLHTNH